MWSWKAKTTRRGAAGLAPRGRTFPEADSSSDARTHPAMHLDAFRDHCLAKPGATEDLPFGPDALTFKVGGKMFAITNLERLPLGVGLKGDPERWLDLRERYEGVTTGPYLNGKHWSLVLLQDDVPASLVLELADRSYDLVVAKLTRKERAALPEAGGG